MSFLKNLFGGPASPSPSKFYSFAVKCNRCGETIEGRINLSNDLSVDYQDGQESYFVRKMVMGNEHCFQQIEIELKFDASKKVIEKQANGGTFVE
jgi:hypothetical protein